ncbi:MAG: glycosyltransferase [Nanoarchaeota archaeon]|nr:glycosyltransferase [Nanoarchaeota archaeon]
MKTLTFSIITPSLNQGRYIEETIQSVIYQEGDFAIDYIIMDGGSTDNTLEIIKRYDKLINSKAFRPKCKRLSLRWFSEKDRGQSHAINKGFQIAKGDILSWLCSDDLLASGALQAVNNVLKNEKMQIVFGDSVAVDAQGKKKEVLKGKEFTRKELLRPWCDILHMFYIPQPSVFLRKEVFDKVGPLDEKNHLCMDYDLWIRMNDHFEFHYLNKILSKMRFHKSAKSVKQKYQQYDMMVAISKKYWDESKLYKLSYYKWYPYRLISRMIGQLIS